MRAGSLFTTSPDGGYLLGRPEDFRADTGESGDALMSLLLPNPSAEAFFRGVVRRCLVGVRSIARFGRQDARAWDSPGRYLVNDGEGNVAGALFLPNGRCVAAVHDHESSRAIDLAALAARVPVGLYGPLAALASLPFLTSGHPPGVTAVFWEGGGKLCADEPWHTAYEFGGHVFRDELMGDAAWKAASEEEHELPGGLADLVLAISRRAVWGQRIELTEAEISLLVPSDSKHRDDGLEELLYGGVFQKARGEP
ncbi:MAG TPA: hypothetical protein VFS43_27925 [Polyangiaceae bacterium]|nr:hypothetical protein [Polyangiaceae bacterium]